MMWCRLNLATTFLLWIPTRRSYSMRREPIGELENSVHWVLDIAFREDECRIPQSQWGSQLRYLTADCAEFAQAGKFGQTRYTQQTTQCGMGHRLPDESAINPFPIINNGFASLELASVNRRWVGSAVELWR